MVFKCLDCRFGWQVEKSHVEKRIQQIVQQRKTTWRSSQGLNCLCYTFITKSLQHVWPCCESVALALGQLDHFSPAHNIFSLPTCAFILGALLIRPPSCLFSNYLFHSVPRSQSSCIFTAAQLSSFCHLHFWGPVLDINAAEQTGCRPRRDA